MSYPAWPDPTVPLGAVPDGEGTQFAIWAPDVAQMIVTFDDDRRIDLHRDADGLHLGSVPGIGPGARYGLLADGRPLVDPYARAIDRPYGGELPRGIVTVSDPVPHLSPRSRSGGLIYELNVRGFSILHPGVPDADRGTLRALAAPAVLAHLRALHVDAVELMPIVAWIDERHLPPLGLANAWGYNPVTFKPVDPRLGTLADLRTAVAALHDAGIDVILDLVFNHTGESDLGGPTLSFRGLADRAYYRHGDDGALVNDTGCGNTVACDHPMVRRMILDTLRHFAREAGVDGFRFDLAPILGRSMSGFDPDADLLREIATDPLLADRILIAEPWDIGPGGYQLGRFPSRFLEWNDRYRDDVRRFWRGDPGMIGALATRLAGSSDVFGGSDASRTVNFIAAHDGFTLADLTAHVERHNHANGEDNRDGHGENLSWNNGVEGPSDDDGIVARRRRDVIALLGTLFASRGTIMLTAGDEFGRSQRGNNNAYAQDNPIGWIDWSGRDLEIEASAMRFAAIRAATPALRDPAFLTDGDVDWLTERGVPMAGGDWRDPARGTLQMHVGDALVLVNRTEHAVAFATPPGDWAGEPRLPARSVGILARVVTSR